LNFLRHATQRPGLLIARHRRRRLPLLHRDGAIGSHGGAVHAYVGDEVIVTWPLTADAARNARCLTCFFTIEHTMDRLTEEYCREFSLVPRFRAGMHTVTVPADLPVGDGERVTLCGRQEPVETHAVQRIGCRKMQP
jgi:hypothetical protein